MDKTKERKIRIAILGAGISGLSIAHQLIKNENYDVTVYEQTSEPGGSMRTKKYGDHLVDFGPNSGLDTTPLIREMAEAVGLGDEMIYANQKANKRYILRDNKLHALPTSPIDFIRSSLFTLKGKLRLFAEPFIPRYREKGPESIYDFVVRRLGKEFADYAIDPFVSGVYAGDPKQLCVKSAFPKVKALEDKYGGLIKGMFLGAKERKKRKETSKNYAKMFSFVNGMQTFADALAKHLGDRVKYKCFIYSFVRAETGFKVLGSFDRREEFQKEYDIVISTIPAHLAAKILDDFDESLCEDLLKIRYPKVKVLYVVFKKDQIKQPLDGFGFLIPGNESKRFLGAIWSSTIFPNRTPEDCAAFTLFIGGAKFYSTGNFTDQEFQKIVIAEFKEIMKIEGNFIFLKEMEWEKAIPQYELNYQELEEGFKYFEDVNKGIILAGNYRGGISIGDCVKNSEVVKEKVDNLVLNKYIPRINRFQDMDAPKWEDRILWDNSPQNV